MGWWSNQRLRAGKMPAYRTQDACAPLKSSAKTQDACAPLKRSAKIFLQHWGLWLLGVASLCRRVGSRLENVTVSRARNQFRTIHTNLDAASFSRMRLILGIVAKAVLSSQF